MDDYSMFKQALRGFDKDEVLTYIRHQEEESSKQLTALEKDIRKRDKIISELKSRVVLKDEQVERLEKDIRNRYQKYIDNYRQIGDLVYESKVKGDEIIAVAKKEAEKILAAADQEAKRRLASVQSDVDAKLNDGKKKYLAVQDEMNEIVDMFNQMQKKFMQSYKEVHEIIQSMPVSLDDIDLEEEDSAGDDFDDFDGSLEDLDDYDDMDDKDLDALLDFDFDDGEEGDFSDPGMTSLKR